MVELVQEGAVADQLAVDCWLYCVGSYHIGLHMLPHPVSYQATKNSVQARTTSYLCLDVLRKG